MTAPAAVRTTATLSADEVAAAISVADAAAAHDGTPPLSEQSLLAVRHGVERTHLLAYEDRALVGYAQLDRTAKPAPTGELVVAPTARRHGVGGALAAALLAAADGPLSVWAHGDQPGAAALARQHGLARTRSLWQLRRPLDRPLDDPVLPTEVSIRSFVVGQDEPAWLRVNARAFADHPEQGRWTLADLQQREGERWFDPVGFLLAVRKGDDTLLGFHWTKVPGAVQRAGGADSDDAPIGEVYVIGVDPELGRGLHLGTALMLAGLRHLRDRGVRTVLLYVDGSNARALSIYVRLGFTRHSVDVTFAQA